MTDLDSDDGHLREQLNALYRVAIYRPLATAAIVGLSIFAALMEGVGLSFLVPIIEIAQGNASRDDMSGVGQTFFDIYEFLNIPFTLEYIVIGVGFVMALRYVSSFLVAWFQVVLQTDYVRHLQTEGFDHALDARVAYYDDVGSDEILNAIVTQANYAGKVITKLAKLVEQTALSLVYLSVALFVAPVMTALTAVLLGVIVLVMRWAVESGYSVGDRIAEANERLHESAQAGTQGIRDVKLFQLSAEIFRDFTEAVDLHFRSSVKKARNEAAMNNLYQLLTALTVFVLIYFAVAVAERSVAELGIFLFAVFRLAPRVSTLNNTTYKIAGDLPHLVRMIDFIDRLGAERERNQGAKVPDSPIETVAFDDVRFAYDDDPQLCDVSFGVDRGEFVAFVGPSGAGKSTVVSLVARLYTPDDGRITANGTPIDEYDLDAWRARVSVVRQQPFIFNDTLRYNVTVGDRDATEAEIREACELAKVTEFFDELPHGYETELGDDGVRLSGGQRQRIAIARALLKDADVVVLDEATSDLDTALEEDIQANLENAESDRILVVVAHRLSTVEEADRIYAMEDGRIVETGTHLELVERDGTYAELYGSQ